MSGREVDAEGGGMRRGEDCVEVGVQASGVDRVAPCDGAGVRSPYPAVVDPFKRRVALREYVKQLRGDNKENERGKDSEVSEKSPVSGGVVKKTLGLCRRHVGGVAAVAVSREGMLRDKRKFNAPRQTPEKRQRPDQVDVSPGTELSRMESRMVVEEGGEEMSGGMRQPVFSFASREHVQLELSPGQVSGGDGGDGVAGARWSPYGGRDSFLSPAPSPAPSPSRQAQLPESYTLPFKWQAPEPKTPTIRKPLAPVNIPVNRQTVDLHPSPMDQPRPNFSGSLERNSSGSGGSLFQTASGKPFQASAAAKARAALLFESDAELADFFAMEL
ncbi:hypothetical protein KC19_9G141900 [Ceratodon purpureus]|uniref:Uncharacterized protein n=1 Tax=Ceratodon purpureus TaxID=3225 RepID=A0A8T0GW76_CERPU|nr:hypothetical protein KC19_9G141900 [Ceratodon purpureus]